MNQKLTQSEAGKLGQLASKETNLKAFVERQAQYNSNPTLCKNCNKPLPYKKRHNRFCNQSCNATLTNASKPRRRKLSNCQMCNKEITGSGLKYCSFNCSIEHIKAKGIANMLELGYDPTSNCKNAKRYIIQTRGHTCQICNLSEWTGQPIPLTLDHINNNPEDNSLDNLRVICPNCDRLTPNFGSKNRGNGRAARRQRYAEGKSY